MLASELIANAVTHSASAHGGAFTVMASHGAASVHIEVADEGGPWTPSHNEDGEGGRGLLIVSRLASAWAITGDSDGRVIWFEIDCP